LFAGGEKEQAMDELVQIIRRNRSWEEDKARKKLLEFFEALGPSDPLTLAGRRKLSSVLFS
jgi:putative thioredoxin